MMNRLLLSVIVFATMSTAFAGSFGLLEAFRYTKQPEDMLLIESGILYASEEGFVAGEGTLYPVSVAFEYGLTPASLDAINGKTIVPKASIDFYRSQEDAFDVDYLSTFDFSVESYLVIANEVYIVTVADIGKDPAPTATLKVTKKTIKEGSGKTSAFVITLNKAAKRDLPIPYTLTGTADVVDDFNLPSITYTARVKKGKKSVLVVIKPTDNHLKEPKEKVTMTLNSNAGYNLTKAKKATITITDDD